ncbi:MAG: hypothetical protein R3Y27_00100 [Clostridia bacterium]
MKRSISLLLAVIMMISMFSIGFTSSATSVCKYCEKECTQVAGTCTCCAECEYLNTAYLLPCAKDSTGHFSGETCCEICTGTFPCDCNCDCCSAATLAPEDDDWESVLSDDVQDTLSGVFQDVLDVFEELFDSFFEVIYNMLGFEYDSDTRESIFDWQFSE